MTGQCRIQNTQNLGLTICQTFISPKVVIMDLYNTPREFRELNIEDKDLTMFTLTQLRLEKQDQVVQMAKNTIPNTKYQKIPNTKYQIPNEKYNIPYTVMQVKRQGSHHVHTNSAEAGKAGSGGPDSICDGDGKYSMPNTSYELQHTVSEIQNGWFSW